MTVEISCLGKTTEFSVLSPFYTFPQVVEFGSFKFRSIYIFLSSLKIEDEGKRAEFLEYYLDSQNLAKVFNYKQGEIKYGSKFVKKAVDSVVVDGVELKKDSTELYIFLKNMVTATMLSSIAFKYAVFSTKNKPLDFSEFDKNSNLGFVDSTVLKKCLL